MCKAPTAEQRDLSGLTLTDDLPPGALPQLSKIELGDIDTVVLEHLNVKALLNMIGVSTKYNERIKIILRLIIKYSIRNI